MPSVAAYPEICDDVCDLCHCTGEGCDGTVCHGLDAD